jgi:C4-dicarboxylate-specific signal transduction histidine kinase
MAVLGELTTSMAHELNQPLTAISMVAQNTIALLDTGDPENELLNRKLERIVQQVARAGSIIDHMRIFGRRADDAPADISIASAIEGAVVIVQASLRQSAIEITTLTAPDLPLVRGHLVSLQQVLISLIGNASDAVTMQTPPLPKERRGIEIRAERRGPGAVIRVADHAGGIDESVLPRLFQPFFTTKPTGSGTGLGLSVAYGIITEMGGEIAVRNEGDGAVFEIRLPPAPFETKS